MGQNRQVSMAKWLPLILSLVTLIRHTIAKMPISFSPAGHAAVSIEFKPPAEKSGYSPADLLGKACHDQWEKAEEILQSSFDDVVNDILPRRTNGFVETILEAYNQHHALIIRPDDVWLAILTQFSFFVNGNAELLRSQFVAHDGKKHLVINAAGTRYTADFGRMAEGMATLIQENVVDPTLHEWILPKFSTTTDIDRIVGSIVMMSTTKSYFSYEFRLLCGIPRVTLEGEKGDWEMIVSRLEKLKEYGVQATAWHHLLFPVVSRFVKAFDDPDGEENIKFWQSVAHYDGGGSGPLWLSGWITAFCVFDHKGKWIGNAIGEVPENFSRDIASLTAEEFWSIFDVAPPTGRLYSVLADENEALFFQHENLTAYENEKSSFQLDSSRYHVIDTDEIPPGYATVDVKLNDNGAISDTVLTAGSVGSRVSSSGDKRLSPTGENDTIQPISGWWMFTVKAEPTDESHEIDTRGSFGLTWLSLGYLHSLRSSLLALLSKLTTTLRNPLRIADLLVWP